MRQEFFKDWSVSPLKKAEREARHSAARPKVSEKTAFFPRNDRPDKMLT